MPEGTAPANDSQTAPAQPGRDASLAVRTATGAGWIIMWRMATRVLGIVSTVVLVRLLTPADFGLVALATSFAQAIDSFASMGVNEALVRERQLNRDLYNTGFTLNVIRGVIMSAAIALAATPAAAFFNDARLANILLVLAAQWFLSSIENVGIVDFRRSLAFEKDFQLSILPRLAAVIASIVAAFLLVSYWALVIGLVTRAVLRLVLTYWMHPYRPQLSLRAWRRIVGFSLWNWLNVIAMMIRDRVDTVVVGRVLGPASVGVYAVGWEIGSLPSTELVEPITAALFAGFSAARRSGGDQADGYLRAISVTLLLTLPMGMGLSMVAAPVIHLAFGPKWMEAVPLVQVFAIVSMLKVVAYFSGVLFNANDLIHVQFRILLVSLAVRVGVLLALIHPLGLMGAAVAAAACVVVEEALFLLITFRNFGLSVRRLFAATWRCVLATAAMVGVLAWQGVAWAPGVGDVAHVVRELLLAVSTGAATYGLVLLALWYLSGRPEGAELTFIRLLGNTLRHALRRWRRQSA